MTGWTGLQSSVLTTSAATMPKDLPSSIVEPGTGMRRRGNEGLARPAIPKPGDPTGTSGMYAGGAAR